MRPTHLIDALIPRFDRTIVHDVVIEAPVEVVFDSVRAMDFLAVRTPLITTLFVLRDAPARLSRWLRADLTTTTPSALRLADLFDGAVPSEWIGLAEDRPHEIVFGAVATVWKPKIEWLLVAADDFCTFSEPGYAKMAVSFATEPIEGGHTRLSYEARTTTTDARSKRRFNLYWFLVRPFVRIIMRASLRVAKKEAEQSTDWISPDVAS